MKNIIFLVMISILLISCSSLKSITKEPEVTFDSVKITNLNFTSADFIFKYKVNNPNNVSLNIEQFKYDLFVENDLFLSGVSPAPISVGKNTSSFVDIPVTVVYKNLFDLFSNIYRLDTANYKLATEFTLKLPVFGKKVFPLEHKGTFPVLKLPEVALKEVKTTAINLLAGTATIEFAVDIINKNTFAISPDSFTFELFINKAQWLNGLLKDIGELAPNKSTTVKIPVTINVAKVGKDLFDNIFSGSGIFDVSLKGNMAMRTAYPGIGSTNIPFSIEKSSAVKK
ncbi:MAG: LEA type 2 family protein [Spirochaetaceae bacterium]|nr:LEA type 2 family protein [Spirochaetaceae bacterium]